MVWMGRCERTSCSSLGTFWLPGINGEHIGRAVIFGDGFTLVEEKLLTGHVSSVGVPNVSKIDLISANSLPSSPASKSVLFPSPTVTGRLAKPSIPYIAHSATTQPAAHMSISGP